MCSKTNKPAPISTAERKEAGRHVQAAAGNATVMQDTQGKFKMILSRREKTTYNVSLNKGTFKIVTGRSNRNTYQNSASSQRDLVLFSSYCPGNLARTGLTQQRDLGCPAEVRFTSLEYRKHPRLFS